RAGEGWARGSRGEEIDARVVLCREVEDAALDDVPLRPVEAQGRAGRRVIIEQSDVAEASTLNADCSSARACTDLDRGPTRHAALLLDRAVTAFATRRATRVASRSTSKSHARMTRQPARLSAAVVR